jgi:hypothetical protein
MVSKRFSLNKEDVFLWAKMAFIFLAPVALIYFAFVGKGLENGFDWADFVPDRFVMGSIATYIIGQILALAKKFVQVNKY